MELSVAFVSGAAAYTQLGGIGLRIRAFYKGGTKNIRNSCKIASEKY